jgi:hypothetical protein
VHLPFSKKIKNKKKKKKKIIGFVYFWTCKWKQQGIYLSNSKLEECFYILFFRFVSNATDKINVTTTKVIDCD